MTAMETFSTIAAVDLGSNSFRLQVGRVVDDQIYPLDSLREPVRLAAGGTPGKKPEGPGPRHRVPEALRRAPARPAAGGGAGGRNQYAAGGQECARLRAAVRGRARVPDRNRGGAGRGSPDLPRGIAQP